MEFANNFMSSLGFSVETLERHNNIIHTRTFSLMGLEVDKKYLEVDKI